MHAAAYTSTTARSHVVKGAHAFITALTTALPGRWGGRCRSSSNSCDRCIVDGTVLMHLMEPPLRLLQLAASARPPLLPLPSPKPPLLEASGAWPDACLILRGASSQCIGENGALEVA